MSMDRQRANLRNGETHTQGMGGETSIQRYMILLILLLLHPYRAGREPVNTQ